jgi:phenylacetate-CoA ligase
MAYAKEGVDLFSSEHDRVRQKQNELIEKLLIHANERVPYYSDIFAKLNLFPFSGIDGEAFNQIPILSKDIIRSQYGQLLSNDYEKRGPYINTSGGSTGEPVRFMQDREYFYKNFGNKILFGLLNQKYPGDKELKLWGSERDVLEGTIGIKDKLINAIYNRDFANSFCLDNTAMRECLTRINRNRPVQIWTYADSIYELSRFILANKANAYCPLNIVTTAGSLYPEMRETIKRAFPNSRVINQYGSREAGVIGVEIAPVEGIRVFDHSVLLEVLDEQGNIRREGPGRLLVTNLTNYSMPLIRFDIGDIGEITLSAQGHTGGFSILKNLKGRINAHIKKEDGSIIHGEYFTHLFYGKDWVKHFQVIQHSFRQLEFIIVLRDGCAKNQSDLQGMIHDTQAVMGDCEVIVSIVPSISKLDSGKYQYVYSEVQ